MASLDEKWKAVDNFKSVVVDRERDVVRVTKELYDLHSNREQLRVVTSSNNYRLTIPFAPHMFGSGKTTFYVTYLELVRWFSETSLSTFAWKPLRRTFLEKLKRASLLYIDLRLLKPTLPTEEKRNLEWAVYYLLIKAACLQSGLPQPDPDECFKELKLRTDAVVQKFRSILNIPSDQYLLIAFDEVGVLDESLDEFHFKRTHDGRVRPYNDFIGIISQLCKEPDLFFIVVGKSEGLNIYNYVASVSRVQLVFIPLSPLEKHSIVEHLEKSSSFLFPGSPKVSEILCHEDFSTSELAELLLELTGGVPGLLVRAISYLLLYKSSNNNFLLSKETFLIIMNSFLVTNYCVATFLPRLISLSEQRKRLLRMLTLLSLYRIRFDFDETVQISSNSDVFLFDLVTDMYLYRRLVIEPDRNERYEVLIPKLLIEYIDQGLKDDRLEWLLLQTLKSQSVDFFYESKCRILEGLIATLFYLHFSRHPTNSSMLSTLGQLSRVWNEMNLQFSSESAAYYMKSIHYTRTVSGTERMTFGSNDEWERIVEEMLEFEKIYIPFHSTFHSPDILFKLHGRTNEKNLMVGIACKGRWSRSGIRWNEILEEAHKFLKPVHDQVLTSHPTWHCMLIIMSTQLATNVSEDLNYSSRCYSSGDSVEDFVIPHNCELVILSEADVENFIGKDILSNLRNAFKSVDNPHSRNIGISTLQEIVLSLSKNI
ncbi:archaeal ATPase [Galdieria sulphuraria]|uniref:Archaeal ATPase n=1 Tax=Galdieria sulphuraria TaxID=130081 RepID=M2XRX8_GALSU|nr:archaeal ATPase [Galdieria sulphuraria]EME26189.1 archaeal ATPase [Galdieria sulphuraria]|eukprot:XP_005702709.1 archaeal ATPase [Galdieria sulphuraria]